MAWRVAKSLDTLLGQINEAAPKRSKISDGGIGDANHQNRTSDHNPWCSAPADPTVTARDYTHDPGAGADMGAISEALRQSKDGRIKYVIFNRRIFSSTVSPWVWRSYGGANPHTKHMHVSVNCDSSKDSTGKWSIGAAPVKQIGDILRRGDRGPGVTEAQRLLKAGGYDPGPIDGIFGAGTEKAVNAFKANNGLNPNGVVGAGMWKLLIPPTWVTRWRIRRPDGTLGPLAGKKKVLKWFNTWTTRLKHGQEVAVRKVRRKKQS